MIVSLLIDMMGRASGVLVCWGLLAAAATAHRPLNSSLPPTSLQLPEWRHKHPNPKLWTLSSGSPVEIRDIIATNTHLLSNELFLDMQSSVDAERIPERNVHAKGTGAYGYFEVTNDVSMYTKADVFNGIGKKTRLFSRFSTVVQNLGGDDTSRETKALAIKFYTKEGNLDLICLHNPLFFYNDPNMFLPLVHALKRNPRTNLIDNNSRLDFLTLKPSAVFNFLRLLSDFGIPNGYRTAHYFPIHTYEVVNEKGEVHYVRFNFFTEQGLQNFTTTEGTIIAGRDPDYYNRELYNAIENGAYPSWRLDLYVMSFKDLLNVDYDPFDLTRDWKNGTYKIVTVGRLVLDKNPDNMFRDSEMSAFCPSNLVPGILGSPDNTFVARRFAYRDAHHFRLGINRNKIHVNQPLYAKTYNRDGMPPVKDNERDAPNYYPNFFNGPAPYVDASRPTRRLRILQSNAVDLQPSNDFYNIELQTDAERQRLATNIGTTLATAVPDVQRRFLHLLKLIDRDLYRRSLAALQVAIVTQNEGLPANYHPNPQPSNPHPNH